MDPNVTLREMLVCYALGHIEDAQYSAQELNDWLNKGGVTPNLGQTAIGTIIIDDYEIRAAIQNILSTREIRKF